MNVAVANWKIGKLCAIVIANPSPTTTNAEVIPEVFKADIVKTVK